MTQSKRKGHDSAGLVCFQSRFDYVWVTAKKKNNFSSLRRGLKGGGIDSRGRWEWHQMRVFSFNRREADVRIL